MAIRAGRTARFWVWVHGWVKLSLRPGQSLTHSSGGPCEEGWSYRTDTWTHWGNFLALDSVTQAQDCDGRLDTYHEATAAVLEPYYEWVAPDRESLVGPRPVWHRQGGSQRDHTAEAMGY